MSKEWFVRERGKTLGPITSEALKTRVANGTTGQSAEIANATDGPWHPITKLKGLAWPTPKPIAYAVEIPTPAKPDGESLLWKGSPSQLTNLSTYVWCTLFFWLVVPVFVALWRFLKTRTTIYEVTNERIKTHSGVIAKTTEELELHRVRDSSFRQSVFDRMVGLASITLATNDVSSPSVRIAGLPAKPAKELREQIRRFADSRRALKGVREFESH